MERKTVSLAGIARLRAWPLIMLATSLALSISPQWAAARGPVGDVRRGKGQDEHLEYSVRWLGLRCGVMSIHSTTVNGTNDATRVIALAARTSRFFDRIYRVRIHIESRSSVERLTTTFYRRVHEEEDTVSEEELEIDRQGKTIIHREDGRQRSFSSDGPQPLDPLAFLFRLRSELGAPGDRVALNLVTADGPEKTTARVEKRSFTKTPLGRFEVLHVLPEAPEGAMFRQSGKIEMWIGTEADAIPYRIEFKLPLGTLVAVLSERGSPQGDS